VVDISGDDGSVPGSLGRTYGRLRAQRTRGFSLAEEALWQVNLTLVHFLKKKIGFGSETKRIGGGAVMLLEIWGKRERLQWLDLPRR
jgi:hypothetical protein